MMHEKNLVEYLKTENFLVSIDRASIEYQSSQADSNQIFKHNFDRSKNTFGRSKIWKFEIFEKQRKFYEETTQTNLFHE